MKPYDLDLGALELKKNDVWPTTFFVARFPEAEQYKSTLIELCRKLAREGKTWDIARRSKLGLFESPPDFFTRPEAQPLMQFCGALIATLFQRDVTFPQSWCHITNDGGMHDTHAHVDFARNGICGIYYLQCSECGKDPPNGINRFYSPDVFAPNDVVDFVPREGRVILFPGQVRHSALPYRGAEDRIVVSFNGSLTGRSP